MQFFIVTVLAALAAFAYAAPTTLVYPRACDITNCAIALGPTAVTCVGAAVQAGLDPITDAACFVSVLNSAVNAPAACAGCAPVVQSAVDSALGSVDSAIGSAENALSSIF